MIYIYIVNQARNEQEVNVIANLIKGLQEGFNFQRVPTITTNTLTILEPSKYQNGEISPNHNKVIICDNTIEKEHWEKINKKINELNKSKPIDYKKEIEKLKKEQFILAPDNLDVLNNLLCDKTIRDNGGVDVIYIDPPYNTGNTSLGYRDVREQNEWLNFMKARLEKAYDLLSDDGIIFISIDDNMHSYLKIICDEVFGRSNFYGNIVQCKGNTQNDSKTIQRNADYVLIYCKKPSQLLLTYRNKTRKEVINDSFYLGRDMGASSGEDKLVDRPNLGYTIYYYEKELDHHFQDDKNIQTANKLFPGFKSYIYQNKIIHAIALVDYDCKKISDLSQENEIYNDNNTLIKLGYSKIRPPKRNGNKLGRWTWSIDSFIDSWNNDEIAIINKKNIYKKINVNINDTYVINKKRYIDKVSILPIQNIIQFSSANGTIQLSSSKEGVIPGCKFSNPKNVDMIKFLINSYDKKDAIILDFFAGSGTTAQAVMELNNEDGGNRKFYICTKLFDFISQYNSWENIGADVMLERVSRISLGKTKDGNKITKKDCPWLSTNTPFNSQFDCLQTKEYDISLKSKINPYKIIDLSIYGYPKLDQKEKEKIINANFQILLNHLNNGGF